MKGTISIWNFERGYGFIICSTGRKYFLHIQNWSQESAPEVGTAVEFEIGPGYNGKKENQAVNVCPATSAGLSALGAAKKEVIADTEVLLTEGAA